MVHLREPDWIRAHAFGQTRGRFQPRRSVGFRRSSGDQPRERKKKEGTKGNFLEKKEKGIEEGIAESFYVTEHNLGSSSLIAFAKVGPLARQWPPVAFAV